jgi:hypothetical protein
VKPSEFYRIMKVHYGDSSLSQGRVYEWMERFKNGRQNVSDEPRRGRVVGVATETVKQQIEQRILTTGESLLMKLPWNST